MWQAFTTLPVAPKTLQFRDPKGRVDPSTPAEASVAEGEQVRMHLSMLSGASIDMQVNLDSSVNEFRKCVMEADNLNSHSEHLNQYTGHETVLLLFAGKELSDGHTLRSYKIPADACIQVLSVSPVCWHSCTH